MVKTEIPCPCGGSITAVRDLEDETGAAELEERHLPGCQHDRDEAKQLASPAALWVKRREGRP